MEGNFVIAARPTADIALADGSQHRYPRGMAGSATQSSPSVIALATAWILTLATEVGWSVVLYNYDGEMGDTPPASIWTTIGWACVVASGLVAVAWAAVRLRRPAKPRFWVFLLSAFAAKGILLAGLEGVWVPFYTAAPFTLGHSYRDEALSIAAALASGVAVSLVVRAIDAKRTSVIDHLAAHFD
jgi:hypothetical protein